MWLLCRQPIQNHSTFSSLPLTNLNFILLPDFFYSRQFWLKSRLSKNGEWLGLAIVRKKPDLTHFYLWPRSKIVLFRCKMFMSQTELCFLMQTPCRMDGQPPNWILSTTVSHELYKKRRNWNPFFWPDFITKSDQYVYAPDYNYLFDKKKGKLFSTVFFLEC
jgi:hypothetical protein